MERKGILIFLLLALGIAKSDAQLIIDNWNDYRRASIERGNQGNIIRRTTIDPPVWDEGLSFEAGQDVGSKWKELAMVGTSSEISPTKLDVILNSAALIRTQAVGDFLGAHAAFEYEVFFRVDRLTFAEVRARVNKTERRTPGAIIFGNDAYAFLEEDLLFNIGYAATIPTARRSFNLRIFLRPGSIYRLVCRGSSDFQSALGEIGHEGFGTTEATASVIPLWVMGSSGV